MGIDVINVILNSSEIERNYSRQLQLGIDRALQSIPLSSHLNPTREILHKALYSKDYITKSKEKS